ncbi:hypothetical protein JXL83_01890 [candidate division WOR-3 bacterium]|nr:hypothetical protein [candidate division WOR-3 bacterium]
MRNDELLNKILEKLPELSGVDHDVKTVEATPDRKLGKKLGVSFPKKPGKKMRVFTFRRNVTYGESVAEKITRVTIDEEGLILKVTQSK